MKGQKWPTCSCR